MLHPKRSLLVPIISLLCRQQQKMIICLLQLKGNSSLLQVELISVVWAIITISNSPASSSLRSGNVATFLKRSLLGQRAHSQLKRVWACTRWLVVFLFFFRLLEKPTSHSVHWGSLPVPEWQKSAVSEITPPLPYSAIFLLSHIFSIWIRRVKFMPNTVPSKVPTMDESNHPE